MKSNFHHLKGIGVYENYNLHMPIRKSETLPTAKQVCFASQIDVLLAEIVRIIQ